MQAAELQSACSGLQCGEVTPIKSLDEGDTNGQQLSIKTGKTFSFFKIFMKPNEAGSCGCDLLHGGKPEQPHDPFAFTPGKSLASGLPKGLSAALVRRKKAQLFLEPGLRHYSPSPLPLETFSFPSGLLSLHEEDRKGSTGVVATPEPQTRR